MPVSARSKRPIPRAKISKHYYPHDGLGRGDFGPQVYRISWPRGEDGTTHELVERIAPDNNRGRRAKSPHRSTTDALAKLSDTFDEAITEALDGPGDDNARTEIRATIHATKYPGAGTDPAEESDAAAEPNTATNAETRRMMKDKDAMHNILCTILGDCVVKVTKETLEDALSCAVEDIQEELLEVLDKNVVKRNKQMSTFATDNLKETLDHLRTNGLESSQRRILDRVEEIFNKKVAGKTEYMAKTETQRDRTRIDNLFRGVDQAIHDIRKKEGDSMTFKEARLLEEVASAMREKIGRTVSPYNL